MPNNGPEPVQLMFAGVPSVEIVGAQSYPGGKNVMGELHRGGGGFGMYFQLVVPNTKPNAPKKYEFLLIEAIQIRMGPGQLVAICGPVYASEKYVPTNDAGLLFAEGTSHCASLLYGGGDFVRGYTHLVPFADVDVYCGRILSELIKLENPRTPPSPPANPNGSARPAWSLPPEVPTRIPPDSLRG